MNETIPYVPGLSPVAGKELCAWFDGGRLSSAGGEREEWALTVLFGVKCLQNPWRWESGTISTNLDGIRGMSGQMGNVG